MKPRFPVKTDLTVRFADVDVMGHVNNAVYLSYFEQARVAFFKKIHEFDLRYMDAKSAFGFIVAEIGVKFLAPTFVDQVLTVALRVAEVRNKAFRFEYEIRDKKTKVVVATGFSVQVSYNYRKHKPFPLSPSLKRRMLAL
ncbi:MAG TPA: thioesterase family protein [bacterium]|nr:thioesterase family protein [bacterium]